jgi:hypothetical protein
MEIDANDCMCVVGVGRHGNRGRRVCKVFHLPASFGESCAVLATRAWPISGQLKRKVAFFSNLPPSPVTPSPHGDECVFDATGEQVAGNVTSGAWSPTLNKAICLAYVPADASQPGTQYKACPAPHSRPPGYDIPSCDCRC